MAPFDAAALAGSPLAGLLAEAVRSRPEPPAPLEPVAGARTGRTADGPVVQRLVSSKKFAKDTDLALATRGKTLKQIDAQLKRAHGQMAGMAQASRDGRPRNAIKGMLDSYHEILAELEQLTAFWLRSHEHDSSRSRHRRPAIQALHDEAASDIGKIGSSYQRLALQTPESQPSSFVAKLEGDASSVLTKLATPIGLAIPMPGDSVSGGLSVKIPCDQTGTSYLGFRVGLSAARMDNKATSLNCEIAFIGGVNVGSFLDLGGEFGLTLTAQGKTPEQALKLISWGWYRAFRESPIIPREVANLMWGGSATYVGWMRSEQWAANIEKEAFSRKPGDVPLSSGVGSAATTNEYVRIGALAGVSATAKLGEVAELEASLSTQLGSHYDQRSVEIGKAKRGKQVGEALKMPARGKSDQLGTFYTSTSGSFAASGGPFSGSLAFTVALMGREQTAKKRDRKIPEGYVSISGSFGATVPMNAAIAPLVVNALKNLAPKMGKFLGVVEKKAGGKLGPNALGAAGTTLVSALNDLPEGVTDTVMNRVTTPQPTDLSLTISAGYELGGDAGGWAFDIAVGQEVSHELDVGVVGLSLSKSSRLLRIILAKDGKWKLTAN